jgi:hypothetical protein
MLRLIETDLSADGKPDLRKRTPTFFVNGRAEDTLFRERLHLQLQVVAQEIEFVWTILFGRMESSLAWWKCKDQPAVSGIDGLEAEYVAKERAIGLGVLAIDDYVGARDHAVLQSKDAEILVGNKLNENCKIHSISDKLELG